MLLLNFRSCSTSAPGALGEMLRGVAASGVDPEKLKLTGEGQPQGRSIFMEVYKEEEIGQVRRKKKIIFFSKRPTKPAKTRATL